MIFWKYAVLVFFGLASGSAIAAGIYALIAAIGVVPRMAQRTNTVAYIPRYEDAITLGGIFGTTTMFIDYYLPIGRLLVMLFSGCIGIFIGCVAVALAEILNVMPIFMRRSRMTMGITCAVLGLALGKAVGSAIYFLIQGFYIM